MRKDPLITGEYYHIYNRGVDKRDIFMDKQNLERFALSVKIFNSVKPVGGLRNHLNEITNVTGVQHRSSRLNIEDDNNLVSIVCYCFNPNHFHFIVKQEVDGGISEFFKRLLGGYTNYFNKFHQRTGALFQGRFKSHLINDEEYFLKIHPYVNSNYLIHDIPKEKEHLVLASDQEYKSGILDIVSQDEAGSLLEFYGNQENFEKECSNTIDAIRKDRGKVSLSEEDLLP